jgi:oligosaccharide reducing-end xylanase
MLKKVLLAWGAALLTLNCIPKAAPAAPPPPAQNVVKQGPPLAPPAHGAFKTGRYRNLFVERGQTPEAVEQRINAAYERFFHGDPKSASVMFPGPSNSTGPTAYIMDIGNADVRSEGMSYGMMIAVQMDRKADFDALWNWARTFMYHADPKHPAHGYFSWQMKPDGTPMDEMPAPDGEEYFAMSLLFASHRWGDGKGIYDYGKEARRILKDMVHRSEISGATVKGPKRAASLFNAKEKQVRFSPDLDNWKTNGDHTNPSYHLPAFYELFALWGAEADREFWREAASVSRDYFVKAAHPKTGLSPDYANFDGTPRAASWDPNTVQFRWDAWRVAINWSMDYAWFAADPRQLELSDRLQAFFEQQGPKTYGNNYTLDGVKTDKWHSAGLVGANAVASLAATHPRAWLFVDDLWNMPLPAGKWRYYDGMLYLFGYLHVSGQFRIYGPPASPGGAATAEAAETKTSSQRDAPKPLAEPGKMRGAVMPTRI